MENVSENDLPYEDPWQDWWDGGGWVDDDWVDGGWGDDGWAE
ncbi:MAG: hypothetical protein M5R36_03800 [Deltaproteobacteria bacterium]|nr:hypothetical protein [Deltaproteobacteria bacterium]